MNQTSMLKTLEEKRIVPVVKLDSPEDALPLAEALCRGGLPVAEVTFRTDAAEESIRRIRKAFPEMILGAGTVINAAQAQRACDAGASFLVSPGISEDVLRFAVGHDVPVFPGVCTPSEIMTAVSYGLEVVKFFPAGSFGGVKTMKALAGPFPGIRFLPTGGIGPDNLAEYLAFEKVIAVGGSWMVKDTFIRAHDFAQIEKLCADAVQCIKAQG